MGNYYTRIVKQDGFYFVVKNFGATIYTYAIVDTLKQAEEILTFIDNIDET